MIKYESTLVTFTEVPDEISLCFNITGCPCKCEGCFEPWLREDTGTKLEDAVFEAEIASHPHITCVCFMGGDGRYNELAQLIKRAKINHPNLKFAMYSGVYRRNNIMESVLDYYKVGPYIRVCGPLNSPTTNQRFYKNMGSYWEDITYRFQEKKA